jgi:hypothetical protein
MTFFKKKQIIQLCVKLEHACRNIWWIYILKWWTSTLKKQNYRNSCIFRRHLMNLKHFFFHPEIYFATFQGGIGEKILAWAVGFVLTSHNRLTTKNKCMKQGGCVCFWKVRKHLYCNFIYAFWVNRMIKVILFLATSSLICEVSWISDTVLYLLSLLL